MNSAGLQCVTGNTSDVASYLSHGNCTVNSLMPHFSLVEGELEYFLKNTVMLSSAPVSYRDLLCSGFAFDFLSKPAFLWISGGSHERQRLYPDCQL